MVTYKATLLYLVAGIVWLLWLIWSVFLSQKKKTGKKIILQSLTFAYIIIVFGVTLFPLPNFPLEYPPGQNFMPFNSITEIFTSQPTSIAFKQIAGNIIMFLPFGLLIPFFIKKHRFIKCILFAILFSVLIESLQYILGFAFVGSQYRVVDIDDVILNLVGSIIGYGLFKITPHFIKDPLLKSNKKRIQIYKPEIVLKKRP